LAVAVAVAAQVLGHMAQAAVVALEVALEAVLLLEAITDKAAALVQRVKTAGKLPDLLAKGLTHWAAVLAAVA
jgi:hypothetical protein